jgi:hypothetical protein
VTGLAMASELETVEDLGRRRNGSVGTLAVE